MGGNSSVGRAQPCQGWGREFESRFPLQIVRLNLSHILVILANLLQAGWQSGYAAACKAVDAGSIPTPASISIISIPFLLYIWCLKSVNFCSRARVAK